MYCIFSFYNTKPLQFYNYFFCLGSNASVKPSPIKLNNVTVRKIAKPGKIATHNCDLPPCARDNNFPQVNVSGGIPNPIKDKNDSVSIAAAIPNAMVIKTGDNALGIACFNKIRHFGKPNASDASMYSKLLIFNNSALIKRAISVHEVNPITTITINILGFEMATTAIIKNKRGIDTNTSIRRCTIISKGRLVFGARNGIFLRILEIKKPMNKHNMKTKIPVNKP